MAHRIEDAEVASDEEYDENADEDFDPDRPNHEDNASSSSDEDAEPPAKQPRKEPKKRNATAFADDGWDSGDEVTVQQRKKRRRKAKSDAEHESEGEGQGGLIKTRAQRLTERTERQQRKCTGAGDVTVDVNRLWADLNSVAVGRPSQPPSAPTKPDDDGIQPRPRNDAEAAALSAPSGTSAATNDGDDDMITTVRRMDYAGEIIEVEDRVARSSKKGRAHLARHPPVADEETPLPLQRPLKRPSLFEPNPHAIVKGVPRERLRPVLSAASSPGGAALSGVVSERNHRAEKMTTVQKSAVDWHGYVEREGLKEELDVYGKSRTGFLEKEAFLDRAAGAREMAARAARGRAG